MRKYSVRVKMTGKNSTLPHTGFQASFQPLYMVLECIVCSDAIVTKDKCVLPGDLSLAANEIILQARDQRYHITNDA